MVNLRLEPKPCEAWPGLVDRPLAHWLDVVSEGTVTSLSPSLGEHCRLWRQPQTLPSVGSQRLPGGGAGADYMEGPVPWGQAKGTASLAWEPSGEAFPKG